MIRYIKTFEVVFSTNNLSCMHISTMWHSLNVLKYFCPLSVYYSTNLARISRLQILFAEYFNILMVAEINYLFFCWFGYQKILNCTIRSTIDIWLAELYYLFNQI